MNAQKRAQQKARHERKRKAERRKMHLSVPKIPMTYCKRCRKSVEREKWDEHCAILNHSTKLGIETTKLIGTSGINTKRQSQKRSKETKRQPKPAQRNEKKRS